MSLATNRLWADAAFKHVRSKSLKPQNKGVLSELYARAHGLPRGFVVDQRQDAPPRTGTMEQHIDTTSAFVCDTGLGNCGEMAGVAYSYLKAAGAHNFALVNIVAGNHQFVVVGIPNPVYTMNLPLVGAVTIYDNTTVTATMAAPPVAWGPDAVACDPWLSYSHLEDTLGLTGRGARVGCWDIATDWTTQMPLTLTETIGAAPPAIAYRIISFHA